VILLPKSIIIAGTGKNVGKTSFALSIIRKLKAYNPVGVKITPHFHKSDPGEILLKTTNFIISKENKTNTGKDTANFLLAGASEVFFLQVNDDGLGEAFSEFGKLVDTNRLIIFESASLIKHVKPGLFFLVTDNKTNGKNSDLIDQTDKLIINDKKDPDFSDKEIMAILEQFKNKLT
jgi:hypothetical protein